MTADDLAKILDELGQRLGPTGQHVFELAVRQVYISSAVTLVAAAVLVIAYLLTVRFAVRHRDGFVDYNGLTGQGFAAVMGLLLFGLAAVAALLFVPFAVISLLNPEYAALSDLLSRVVPK